MTRPGSSSWPGPASPSRPHHYPPPFFSCLFPAALCSLLRPLLPCSRSVVTCPHQQHVQHACGAVNWSAFTRQLYVRSLPIIPSISWWALDVSLTETISAQTGWCRHPHPPRMLPSPPPLLPWCAPKPGRSSRPANAPFHVFGGPTRPDAHLAAPGQGFLSTAMRTLHAASAVQARRWLCLYPMPAHLPLRAPPCSLRVCAHCGVRRDEAPAATKLKVCSSCREAGRATTYYCSEVCVACCREGVFCSPTRRLLLLSLERTGCMTFQLLQKVTATVALYMLARTAQRMVGARVQQRAQQRGSACMLCSTARYR